MELKDNNVYVSTYFRIETGYTPQGHPPELKEKFNNELQQLLCPLGFVFAEPTMAGACYTCRRGDEELYCHPQILSGYVKKDSVPEIENVLKTAQFIRLRNIDCYEEVFNYTEEELIRELNNHKENIKYKILKTFKTKKKNEYKPMYVLDGIRSGIKYMNPKHRIDNRERIENKFIHDTFLELLEQGKIEIMETERKRNFYRTKLPYSVKKSDKFDGAFKIKGFNGHFFLKEGKYNENIKKYEIPVLFYQKKWTQDSYYFEKERYNEIMLCIA